MRKGFLIYEEMRKYFPIYEEAVIIYDFATAPLWIFLIYKKNFNFFFISVQMISFHFIMLSFFSYMCAAIHVNYDSLQRKELPGLRPNFHIHVSARDLYIPKIGPHTSCSRIGRPIVGI